MNRPSLLCLLCLAALISSCTRYAYYQSPFHTNSSPYKTIPLQKDSLPTALYASGAIALGGANDGWDDGLMAFLGSAYRSHSGKVLQGYYGINFGLGSYNAAGSGPGSRSSSHMNDSLLAARAGAKFFGGIGAAGGINVVHRFNRSEWRILGVEASWMQEFGHYQKFRRELPENAANLISRPNNYLTLGVHTDFVFATRRGGGGFKTGIAWSTQRNDNYLGSEIVRHPTSFYYTQTVHVTKENVTGYIQWNFGFHAASFQMGTSIRLNKNAGKKSPASYSLN